MKIVSIIFLIIAFAYGIVEMKGSAKIAKGDLYNKLSGKDKRELIKRLKIHWKNLIILLSMLFAMALIIISTYMGKGTSYDHIISIVVIVLSALLIILTIYRSRKFNEDVKRNFSS